MIKKIIILLLVLILVFPVETLANDAGVLYDGGGYIDVRIKACSTEAIIGGNIEFDLTVKNKSQNTIENVGLYKVFNRYPKVDTDNSVSSLKPGEKLTAHIVAEVPYNIDWYKNKDSYYVDLDVEIDYSRMCDCGDNDCNSYWEFYHKTNAIPIKITNLFDGLNYIDLKLVENDTVYYFRDNHSVLWDDYIAELNNSVNVTNKHDTEIEDILIITNEEERYSAYVDEFEHNTLKVNETMTEDIEISYFLIEKRIRKAIPTYYKVMFRVEDCYYATQLKKEYPTKILKCPSIDIISKPSDPNDKSSTPIISIKNISNKDYNNIYFDYAYNYDLYKEAIAINQDYIITKLVKNQEIELPYIDNILNKRFIIGYLIDDNFYSWDMHSMIDSYDKELKSYIDSESTDIDKYIYLHQLTPAPTIEPTPTPTQEPTPSPTPTPTKEITPEPTQAIELTTVTKENSMPWWVWMVLALTTICVGVIIWWFRHINKKESDELND